MVHVAPAGLPRHILEGHRTARPGDGQALQFRELTGFLQPQGQCLDRGRHFAVRRRHHRGAYTGRHFLAVQTCGDGKLTDVGMRDPLVLPEQDGFVQELLPEQFLEMRMLQAQPEGQPDKWLQSPAESRLRPGKLIVHANCPGH